MEVFPSSIKDAGIYMSDFLPPFPDKNMSTLSQEECTREQLLELLQEKEVAIAKQQKTLAHFRSWMDCIQNQACQINPVMVENAKRLYVGCLPQGYDNGQELKLFFENLMTVKGACIYPGNFIVSVKIQADKGYGFLCTRSVEETTSLLAFDGILFKGKHLKIRRPSNYDVWGAVMLAPLTPDPTLNSKDLNVCKSFAKDSPNKLFVGGIPSDWNDEQVKELLASQGNLRALNLIMDKVTGKSKGYAFCEFAEEATDLVIAALNQRKIGNKVLTVKRALEQSNNIKQQNMWPPSPSPLSHPPLPPSLSMDLPPSNLTSSSFLQANNNINQEDGIPTNSSFSVSSGNEGGVECGVEGGEVTPNAVNGPPQQRISGRRGSSSFQAGGTSCSVEDVLHVFQHIRNRFGLEVADILSEIKK